MEANLKAQNKKVRNKNQGLLDEVKQKNVEIEKLKKDVDDKNDQLSEKVGWPIIKLFESSSSDLLKTSRGHHELNSL